MARCPRVERWRSGGLSDRIFSHSPISAVGETTEEAGLNQNVQQLGARLPVQAPEPLRLFPFETKAWHFQVLAADAAQKIVVGPNVPVLVHAAPQVFLEAQRKRIR